jgi:hypothetical protein
MQQYLVYQNYATPSNISELHFVILSFRLNHRPGLFIVPIWVQAVLLAGKRRMEGGRLVIVRQDECLCGKPLQGLPIPMRHRRQEAT